jgi:hypothetical protein
MKNPEDKFSDYIIAKEGEKPLIVKPNAMKKLVKDRHLLGDDLVFCDLQKVWKKARNVQGLRTLFAKLESNLNAIASNPEVDEAFDVIGAIERENLSTQPIRSNKATPNLIAPIESEPELPDNDRPDLQQPASLQDAIKHLQSKSIEDEEIDEENASFYSKYCKPKYLAYVGIFFAFYLSGYYLFFAPAYSLPENKEVIHGKVMLDNKPLVSGAVIAVVNDKEVSGPIGPTGTYRIQNPPKGDLNFKVVSFITLTKGLPKPKNISVVPPAYNKLNKELALNYKGGIKVFDINLKMPVPPPNK